MTIMTPAPDAMPAELDRADIEAAYVAEAGLSHLIGRLIRIIDSLDGRIALLEKRAELGRLPALTGGRAISDAEAERYFAFYSLLPSASGAGRSGTGAGAERDRSGTEQYLSEAERDSFGWRRGDGDDNG